MVYIKLVGRLLTLGFGNTRVADSIAARRSLISHLEDLVLVFGGGLGRVRAIDWGEVSNKSMMGIFLDREKRKCRI